MNSHVASVLAAIALSLLASTAFASGPTISIEFPRTMQGVAAYPDASFLPIVRMGENQHYVVGKLGEPDLRLTDNGWVYRNVKVTIGGVFRPELNNLVVVFNRGKVASMRVAPDHTLNILIADARTSEQDASRTVAARP